MSWSAAAAAGSKNRQTSQACRHPARCRVNSAVRIAATAHYCCCHRALAPTAMAGTSCDTGVCKHSRTQAEYLGDGVTVPGVLKDRLEAALSARVDMVAISHRCDSRPFQPQGFCAPINLPKCLKRGSARVP